MSKLIGKFAVVAVYAVAAGTVAAIAAVQKTGVGAKVWARVLWNYDVQKSRIRATYKDGCAASKAKFNDIKAKVEAKNEAKANS
jgi:LmbE family N-acetylglucosaminyl deacetylase